MKKQFLVPLILGLAVTSVNGKITGQSAFGGNLQTTPTNKQLEEHHSDSHDHKTIMIAEEQPVPAIDLVVYEDSLKGWNLEIKLDNFEFTPAMVNRDNEPNKGHAHLYVNGEKITRIYGNWYYLATLPSGKNEIKVGLNTNGHESLMYQGKLIEDAEVIEVK